MRTRPDTITELQVGGRSVAIDEQGFLVDPDDWDDELANALAAQMNLKLTEDHWPDIRFMRAFLAEYGVAADARFAFRFLKENSSDTSK
jgi:tRNA 2-thiouridine synthesizing protein E